MIFWAITPLLGAVFTEDRVACSLDSTAMTAADLVPSTTNTTKLNEGIIMDAYGITWLGQDFPGFVRADGVIAPFELRSNEQIMHSDSTWTTTTNLYTTNLTCTPAKIGGDPKAGYTFDNGKGCRTDNIPSPATNNYVALYIGYFNDPYVDWSLQDLGCPASTSHTFLAIWATVNSAVYTNVTALFCEPTYSVQRVKATVIAPNNSLVETTPLGPRTALAAELFNTSDFEYLLGAGTAAQPSRAEVTETDTIDQWHRIKDMKVNWPVGNMVGFALGASQRHPNDYFDATVLASSFQAAHQLLFGLAVRKTVSNKRVSPDLRHGMIISDLKAFVIIPELAVVVEIVLGLVTLFILALLLVSSNRKSQLRADPASLSDVIGLAKPFATGVMHGSNVTDLYRGSHRFKLEDGTLSSSAMVSADQSTQACPPRKSRRSAMPHEDSPSHTQAYQPVRPLEMKIALGATFLTVLCAAILILVTVYVKIVRDVGLPLPSTNQAVNQLVLNYIPIMFATFLEPFWILLNRLLCILQPFEEIRQGRAKPSQSLDVKYTSLPPQLIFWRALRARHFLLVAVCVTGFSANFLAVALGALFEDDLTHTQSPTRFGALTTPVINQTALDALTLNSPNPYREPLYVAQSNMTNGTRLPAWVTPRLFFLPFDVTANPSQVEMTMYKGSTQGIGLNVQCVRLDQSEGDIAVSHDRLDDIPHISWSTHIPRNSRNGSSRTSCTTRGEYASTASGSINGTYAAELISKMAPIGQNPSKEEQEDCSRLLVAGFLRANVTLAETTPETPDFRVMDYQSPDALYLGCELSIQIASFDVTVDHEGHVQQYHQNSPLSDSAFPVPQHGNISSLHNGINTAMWSGGGGSLGKFWHRDLIADTWFPYLIKSQMRSTKVLDASLPPPSADTIGPVIHDIFGLLFTITLGINTDIFLPAAAGSTVPGSIIVPSKRVFMSRPMFVVSLVLLLLNIVVATIYYAKRPPRMLKEMPTTIASVLEMIHGSGLATETTDSKSREEWQIGYGRFVGTDGKPHIGIERRPFVVPWSSR
ncbi:MAG: hypothetical protein Q9186_007486 [Xanthomendoza sp. 1 TL-2023]